MLLAFEVASIVQQINTCIASSSNSTPSTSIISPSMDHDQTVATIAKKSQKNKASRVWCSLQVPKHWVAKYTWAESVVGEDGFISTIRC